MGKYMHNPSNRGKTRVGPKQSHLALAPNTGLMHTPVRRKAKGGKGRRHY